METCPRPELPITPEQRDSYLALQQQCLRTVGYDGSLPSEETMLSSMLQTDVSELDIEVVLSPVSFRQPSYSISKWIKEGTETGKQFTSYSQTHDGVWRKKTYQNNSERLLAGKLFVRQMQGTAPARSLEATYGSALSAAETYEVVSELFTAKRSA